MKFFVLLCCLGACLTTHSVTCAAKSKKIKNDYETKASATFYSAAGTASAVKGYITHATPAAVGEGNARYVAYVFVKWGDLQDIHKPRSKPSPIMWKCYITCDSSKWISIMREFVLRGNTRNEEGQLAKKKSKDKLKPDLNPKVLKWESRTSTGVDQIMIRISLDEPTGSGRLVLGDFTYNYVITPAPDDLNLNKKMKKRKAK